MNIAPEPSLVAAALPVPTAAAVVADPTHNVRKPCAVAKGGTAKWSVLFAPGAPDQVVCEVPFRPRSPRAVSGSGSGVMMFLVVMCNATPERCSSI